MPSKSVLSDIVKVTAAISAKDNKIIIAKRGPDDRLAHKWEFPGGKIEINETPEQCLKREMKEETEKQRNYHSAAVITVDTVNKPYIPLIYFYKSSRT